MAERIALRGVRVFDGTQLTEPRTIVFDETLSDDPAGARDIDATGATLLPGLIDAHVHLEGPEHLAALARWGVTTGLDMACWPPERVATLRAVTGSASLRTAGIPAIGPDGNHAKTLGLPPEAIVLTPDDARRFVEARVAEGVDYVKVVAEAPGDGGPPAEAVRAAADAAAEHGLDTVVHAATPGAYEVAVASGARFVTHVPLRGRIRPEDIAAMKAAGQIAIPTVTMMTGFPGVGDDPVRNVAALHEAGVNILAGTDAHVGGGPVVPHGESLHREFELLAEAGLSPVEILRAATIAPARAFGLTGRGEIRSGGRADLVLVEGDPTTDLTATRAIRAVWCGGVETRPEGQA
ncbi:amidohydrolase family protein [Amycolatopsis jiangsuensis]|uniref:Imidazolonepropionase-like amidohydrolase n=1 Tax=Amycolatopsis jiangsuensis TaxID=1181879 RepID=A0A840J1F7_9PSEU|nr:amidohydrolase family protein [Amycolatopsis jiangsuensis]MBB4688921.1 imidazolonepropionase-like amidohydrolase [Amycolatopsis jiangsuensis]